MGYEEVPHTADWSLHAWAESLEELFSECARGMAALAGVRLASGQQVSRRLELSAADPESLLVQFLSEILYLGEEEEVGFDTYEIEINSDHLTARLTGAAILQVEKIIKAVTYHNLQVRQTDKGYEVELVFDV
jgi:SHS2 domain-containing protein